MKNKELIASVDLSGCEKIIMGAVYEYHRKYNKAPNLKDIMLVVEQRHGIEWKLQTVCTFFSRMEKKGLLSIEKNGRYSYYYPVLPFEEYIERELQGLCKIYFEDDKKQMKKIIRRL